MRIPEYFTYEEIERRLEKTGITLPAPKQYREVAVSAFNTGFLGGIEGKENLASPTSPHLSSRFEAVGYEIGEICKKDFIIDGLHPPLVLAAQRADIHKVSERLVNIVNEDKSRKI